MDLKLDGKTALITGASKGIGRAIARSFAAEGCGLRLVARDRQSLDRTAVALTEEFGVDVAIAAADLTDPSSFGRLAEQFEDVDILVNNAGAVPPGAIGDFSAERMAQSWQLKVFGFIGMMNAFYPRMTSRGNGVILNVMGTAGYRGDASLVALTGGNAALMAITRVLGASGPRHGVRVVGVNPGATGTERLILLLQDEARRRFGSADRWPELQAHLPYGRAAMPEEVADVVVFLSSPRANYVSGSIVNVDGGKSELP